MSSRSAPEISAQLADLIASHKILAIARYNLPPVQGMLGQLSETDLIDLTGSRSPQSLLITRDKKNIVSSQDLKSWIEKILDLAPAK